MKGAVAAGHPQSARAGARMLERGGNAVDACVAAAFAAAVCESPLTGLGAGGFMLVHRAADRSARLADFFVAAPGLGRRRRRGGEMAQVQVRFGDSGTTQPFRIGPASVAVPAGAAGLEAVHRAYGRLPWRELVVPACELARGGDRLTRAQAHIHAILDPILRSGSEGRRVYGGPGGSPLGLGDLLRLPDLADTLEALGARGAAVLSRGELARARRSPRSPREGASSRSPTSPPTGSSGEPRSPCATAATPCCRTRRPRRAGCSSPTGLRSSTGSLRRPPGAARRSRSSPR